jgi:hypothetical protein
MHADRRVQQLTYALYVYNGSFSDSGIIEEAFRTTAPKSLITQLDGK